MNKYLIDSSSYKHLQKWAEDFKSSVVWSPYYFKRCEVVLDGAAEGDHFYIEAVKDEYKFSLKDEGTILFAGRISHDPTGERDFLIKFNARRKPENQGEAFQLLKVYTTAFFHANAFMWYGNLVENKEMIASGRNEDRSKIITFRMLGGEMYAVEVGKHKSPSGIFSVRGHLRRYKNGKIIWINEYMKGLTKEENQ